MTGKTTIFCFYFLDFLISFAGTCFSWTTAVCEQRTMNHCQRQRANTEGILNLWFGSGPQNKARNTSRVVIFPHRPPQNDSAVYFQTLQKLTVGFTRHFQYDEVLKENHQDEIPLMSFIVGCIPHTVDMTLQSWEKEHFRKTMQSCS